MASIEKRGDGWRVRWRDPDGTPRSRGCPTARSAKELKTEVEEAVAKGRRWEPAAVVRVPALVSLIDAWLQDLVRLDRAPRTVARAHAVAGPFLLWLRDRLGRDALVSDLSRQVLEDYDLDHVRRGNGIQTRRTALWAIAGPWRWAWDHPAWRPFTPPPAVPKMPKVPAARPKAATWEILDAVVKAADETAIRFPGREWSRRLVMLERGTGWRVSQCLGLTWPDFDRSGKIELRGELGKSASESIGRTVPLPDWLTFEITAWWVADGRPSAGLIVGDAQSFKYASMVVREYWEATGVDATFYKGRPDHAFRIGLISELSRQRVDADAVEYYVGHAIQGVRRHYVDPATLPLAKVAAAIPAPKIG